MKLEIEINEEQERFLRQFAEKQHEGSETTKGLASPCIWCRLKSSNARRTAEGTVISTVT